MNIVTQINHLDTIASVSQQVSLCVTLTLCTTGVAVCQWRRQDFVSGAGTGLAS